MLKYPSSAQPIFLSYFNIPYTVIFFATGTQAKIVLNYFENLWEL